MPAVSDASMPQPYAHGYHFGTAEETGGASAALPRAQQQSATAGTCNRTTGPATTPHGDGPPARSLHREGLVGALVEAASSR